MSERDSHYENFQKGHDLFRAFYNFSQKTASAEDFDVMCSYDVTPSDEGAVQTIVAGAYSEYVAFNRAREALS